MGISGNQWEQDQSWHPRGLSCCLAGLWFPAQSSSASLLGLLPPPARCQAGTALSLQLPGSLGTSGAWHGQKSPGSVGSCDSPVNEGLPVLTEEVLASNTERFGKQGFLPRGVSCCAQGIPKIPVPAPRVHLTRTRIWEQGWDCGQLLSRFIPSKTRFLPVFSPFSGTKFLPLELGEQTPFTKFLPLELGEQTPFTKFLELGEQTPLPKAEPSHVTPAQPCKLQGQAVLPRSPPSISAVPLAEQAAPEYLI